MLAGRQCAECGRVAVDRGKACPFCGAEGGTEVALSGRGALVSWTVIRVAPARYAAEAPYTVGLVELEEGPRLTARIAGDPGGLTAGERLTLGSLDAARGPIFRPASAD
jgi:uncharacterized protein